MCSQKQIAVESSSIVSDFLCTTTQPTTYSPKCRKIEALCGSQNMRFCTEINCKLSLWHLTVVFQQIYYLFLRFSNTFNEKITFSLCIITYKQFFILTWW